MFEIYQSEENRKWYWRLVAGNSQTVATGAGGYDEKPECLIFLRAARKLSHDSVFETFQSTKDKQWYWRLKASDGIIVAIGHEGYTTEAHCLRAIQTDRNLLLSNILIDYSLPYDQGKPPLLHLPDLS